MHVIQLTDAVKEEDKEEVLGLLKELAILNIRLVSTIPGMDEIGAMSLTNKEEAQFKRDLTALLS